MKSEEIAAAWNRLRVALESVSASLPEHQKIQNAAALIESKLFRRKAEPPRRVRR